MAQINVVIWRSIFALAYTATVLPFTLAFFHGIASPSVRDSILMMPVIRNAHTYMLPVFLAALEFASIQIAVSFWGKKNLTSKYIIVVLFLACQAYPVVSLYYDVRIKDYQDLRKEDEEWRSENVEAQKRRIAELKDQRMGVSTELDKIRSDRNSNNAAIDKLALGSKSKMDSIKEEIKSRGKFRDKRESEIDAYMNYNKQLYATIDKKESDLEGYVLSGTAGVKYKSEIDFIVGEFFTYRGAFAAFLALLFPVSIFSVAYILPKNGKYDLIGRPSFDLKDHLKIVAGLPANHHLTYTRTLIPSLRLHLSAMNASKRLAIENMSMNLKDNLIFDNIGEVNVLKAEILKSKIDDKSKHYLVNELHNALDGEMKLN